jgi:hypothetical protein
LEIDVRLSASDTFPLDYVIRFAVPDINDVAKMVVLE